jgi:c-di-GMP-related signal transduction protein
MLTTLLPLRDRRERVVGFAVSSCPAYERRSAAEDETQQRQALEAVPALTRLTGRSLVVPVTPALLRDGAVTRFASTDAVWLLATDALEDATTRRVVERLASSGLHFALSGFPEGSALPNVLVGSMIVLDASKTSPALLESRVRTVLTAGLKPLIRNVDDRATRHRMLATGAPMMSGRLLARGAATPIDHVAEEACLRALATLAAYADGRPVDGAFDTYVHADQTLGASLLRAISASSLGVRGPRSVTHALNVLGRDAVMERLLVVTARMLADAANDADLALIALRRARLLERLGAALDSAPHPRARALAGLLSIAEFALGMSSVELAERLELPPILFDTLTERATSLGKLVDIADTIDYGWWDDLRARCGALGIAPLVVTEAWLGAFRSAREELGSPQ